MKKAVSIACMIGCGGFLLMALAPFFGPYRQAAALTGLAGDVASFYNMSTDEAFTKLKAVYIVYLFFLLLFLRIRFCHCYSAFSFT